MQDYSYKELLFFWFIVTHVRNFCLFCFCLRKKIPLPTPSYPTYLMQGGPRHPEWGPSHLKNCTMGETYLREPVPGATYQGLAPAGSRDSLRMTASAIRKAKARKRGLVYKLGLQDLPWFTQKANKADDTGLTLFTEATGALSVGWRRRAPFPWRR